MFQDIPIEMLAEQSCPDTWNGILASNTSTTIFLVLLTIPSYIVLIFSSTPTFLQHSILVSHLFLLENPNTYPYKSLVFFSLLPFPNTHVQNHQSKWGN